MKTHKLLEEKLFSKDFIKITCGIWNIPEGSQRERANNFRYRFNIGWYG